MDNINRVSLTLGTRAAILGTPLVNMLSGFAWYIRLRKSDPRIAPQTFGTSWLYCYRCWVFTALSDSNPSSATGLGV